MQRHFRMLKPICFDYVDSLGWAASPHPECEIPNAAEILL
jgi:hypothetical protein